MLDLDFYFDLKVYQSIDIEIADITLKSVKKHLWYLTPELVMLGLFDRSMMTESLWLQL